MNLVVETYEILWNLTNLKLVQIVCNWNQLIFCLDLYEYFQRLHLYSSSIFKYLYSSEYLRDSW